MNCKTKLANLILLIFIFNSGFGQSNNHGSPTDIPTIVPPSPNAAAFQKYGDIPVSAYTGVPSINIPLYQVSIGDISVPISISYHASGIKVSEESSRVGLGWVLNAGGVISRNIRGADDFYSWNYGYINNATHTLPNIINGPGGDLGNTFNIQPGCSVNIVGFPDISSYLTASPLYDFQPDQYYYNFENNSGKFIMKSDKSIVLEKQDKISIQCTDSVGTSWVIMTADGFKYTFAQIETFTDYTVNNSQFTSKSAWYLTQILSPKGNQVNFQYGTISNYVTSIGGYSETQNPTTINHTPGSDCQISSGTPAGTISGPVPGKQYTNVYLDKILFRTGEVRFTYADDRTDVQSDRRLTAAQIYNYTSSGASVLVKGWKFNQSYFSGSNDQDYNLGIASNYVTQRMRLDSVNETGSDGSLLPAYKFVYNNQSDNAITLPAKTSFARDHWGYYNGKAGNTSLVPVFNPSASSDEVTFYTGIMGDNRNADPNFTGLWTLNQISYPTGGSTQFQLESNDFDLPKSNVNDHSWYKNHPDVVQSSSGEVYAGNIVDQPSSSQADIDSRTMDLTNLYVDVNSSTAVVSLTAFFLFTSSIQNCSSPQFSGNGLYFTFTNLTTGANIDYQINPFQYIGTFSTCSGGIGLNFSNSYNLTPGKYVWKLHIDPSVTVISTVSLTLRYPVLAASTPIMYNGIPMLNAGFGGGLRVKSITQLDNVGVGLPITKRYDYHFTDAQGNLHSYGRRMSRPIYSYVQQTYQEDECTIAEVNYYYMETFQNFYFGSDSNVPLNGSAGGNVVGYDTVTEYRGAVNGNGKTVYCYSNSPDIILDYSQNTIIGMPGVSDQIPRRPPPASTIPSPFNGNLLEQIDYSGTDGGYVVVRDVVNTYRDLAGQNDWVWYGIETRKWNGGFINGDPCHLDNYVYPAMVSTRVVPQTTTETVYDQLNPSKSIVKTTSYNYDNLTHLQLISRSESISDGRTITTKYTYPDDYADSNSDAAILSMKNAAYMHAIPITTTQIMNNLDGSSNVIGGTISKFNIQNGIISPFQIAALAITSPQNTTGFPNYNPASGTYPTNYEARVQFDRYDSYGNISQDRKASDMKHVYIWDYYKTYPIAETLTADSTDIAFTSFEADGTGNWTVPSSTRDTTTAAITGSKSYKLSNGSVSKTGLTSTTTFTLSYWSRSGTYTVTGSTAVVTGKTINGWTYYEHTVKNTTSVTVSGSGNIDELRLYPSTARMTTYTYNPLVGLSSACDVNNRVTYYQYDVQGRLKVVKDQDGNIVKTVNYHYQKNNSTF
jgi:YD repeat-containing protein